MLKKLILTVGIPQSGKTTWALKQGFPVVNPDSIRWAVHGRPYELRAEPIVWTIAGYMIDALFIVGHQAVILDATNVTAYSRRRWFSRTWELYYHEFPVETDLCKERTAITAASEKHYRELCAVIDRMIAQFESVSLDEGLIEYVGI